MRITTITIAVFLLSISLSLPAISQSSPPIQESHPSINLNSRRLELRKLKFNRKLWNKKNISNYRYTVSNSCFCIPEARGPVVIEVRNGQVVSRTSVATGEEVNPELFQKYDTIPKLFDVIQDAINRRASSLNVQYNAKFGYPTKINIDYNSQIADEELFLTIEKFEIIE